MASIVWLPPWLARYVGTEFKWQQRFVWWPVRSYESNQLIWLKKAQYGWRWVEGPAGEEPVKLERWMTKKEYLWHCLTQR